MDDTSKQVAEYVAATGLPPATYVDANGVEHSRCRHEACGLPVTRDREVDPSWLHTDSQRQTCPYQGPRRTPDQPTNVAEPSTTE